MTTNSVPSTCFPGACLLARSFDLDLERRIGKRIFSYANKHVFPKEDNPWRKMVVRGIEESPIRTQTRMDTAILDLANRKPFLALYHFLKHR